MNFLILITQLRECKKKVPNTYKWLIEDTAYSKPSQNLNHLNYFRASILEFQLKGEFKVTLFPKAFSSSLNKHQLLKRHSYHHIKQKVILTLVHNKNL